MLIRGSEIAVCAHAQYKFGQKQHTPNSATSGGLQVAMRSQLPHFLVFIIFFSLFCSACICRPTYSYLFSASVVNKRAYIEFFLNLVPKLAGAEAYLCPSLITVGERRCRPSSYAYASSARCRLKRPFGSVQGSLGSFGLVRPVALKTGNDRQTDR